MCCYLCICVVLKIKNKNLKINIFSKRTTQCISCELNNLRSFLIAWIIRLFRVSKKCSEITKRSAEFFSILKSIAKTKKRRDNNERQLFKNVKRYCTYFFKNNSNFCYQSILQRFILIVFSDHVTELKIYKRYNFEKKKLL